MLLLLSQALLAVGTLHPRVWLKATMDVAVVSAELRREEREP